MAPSAYWDSYWDYSDEKEEVSWGLIALILVILLVAVVLLVVVMDEKPCKEYKTSCHYGGARSTHNIECNASIDSVPLGYSIHQSRSCIRR